MPIDVDNETVLPPAAGSPREQELEAKLNRRTLWVGLLAFVALTELIVMVEVLRQAT
jgi:hypothetical protein